MKFRSTQNGFITAIRYYKPSGTTGTHTGHLWTNSGSLLASVTFTGESSSGWQQAPLSSPVSITANTTYVVSYFSPSGDYSVTNPFFTSAVTNGTLRGLADGEDGDNGLYRYTSSSAFPNNNYGTSNYWVDVVFSPGTGPDVTAPLIMSVSPVSGASDVSTGTVVNVVFNEGMNSSTITGSTFELRSGSTIIPATVTYNSSSLSATLTPSSSLSSSTIYTATVKGGASGVKDAAGNALASDYTWSFTTSSPPPNEGNGGPILVISTASNPFSRYAVEILRAEGLNEFLAMDISSVTSTILNNYDVVILGEMTVNATQVTMLTNWVNAGGKLIAFRPSSLLTPLMGLSSASGTLSDRYLLVNTNSGPGVGIVNQTIQYHGTANLHTLNGATSIATLYSSATTATSNPAVTTINVGSNGGKAIAFTYDLARSVVYTRQGNPALAGQETDNEQPQVIRPDDLFFPNYLDMNKVAIPQADEQQRLLANIIIQSNLAKKPLPRFWYMPKGYKAAVIFALDDHGTFSGTKDIFDKMISNSPAGCSIDDWECYRATSWFYVGIPLTSNQANTYHSQGFEMGTHVQNGCQDFSSFADLNSYYNTQFQQFRNAYPGLPLQTTHRFHCLVWSDWLTQAKVELSRGVRLSMDYYYWPPSWINGRPGLFTGSGIPMRYADLDGSIIDVYQAPSQLVNENGINYTTDINTLLDNALGSQGYYGFFGAHDDYRDATFSNVAISAAKARNVPIISAKQMLTWLDGRNGSYFGNMTWSGNQLTVPITALSGARNLKCMLPYNSAAGGAISSITRNGSSLSFTTQTIKGMQYAFFDVAIGTSTYVATYTGGSGTAPSVTTHPLTQTVCAGNEVTFTSAASGTPTPTVQWQVSTNGGSSWSNINGSTNNTLTLTVTTADNNKRYRAAWSNSQGTVNSNAAILTVNVLPSAPVVNVENNCGNSVLTANGVTGALLWSTGAATPSITVTAAGTYTVTQTVNGCTSPAGSAVAMPNSTPSAPTVTVADNCGNSVLTANGATGTLLWSTGETTASITVTTPGTYTVTQTVNGCISAAGSGVASPKVIPSAPIVSVVNDCGNSVLTATGITGSLLWSNGATSSSITVTNAGTYTVTQTLNGCTSAPGSGVASPKVIPSAPIVNVVNDCGNSVLTATGVSGSLLWSNGATTSSITVTNAGTYTVTQTLNGCTSAPGSGVASPKAIPSAPIVNVVNDCDNSVLTATGVTGSLLWSNGATTSSITVTDAGTYTVTQTLNGCTSAPGSGVASPKAIPSAPIVSIINDCGNSVLTATGMTGPLLWNTGETTASITIANPGTYTVVQTVDGCISGEGSGTAAPKIVPPAPTVSVANNCGSSVLSAGNYTGTLLWSTGETTPSITVTAGGLYTITQTIGDCVSASGSGTAAPKAIPVAPIVLVSNNCGNSALTAGNYTGTLLWNTGATTPSITVSAAGIYSVTQTVNGCTGAAGTGTAEPVTLAAAPSVSVINNCDNSVLTAGNYTGTLLWNTGATTSSITVTAPGTYTVAQVIDGCSGNAAGVIAAPISSTIAAPAVSVVNNCGSSTLTAGNYTGTLLWSTGETTPSITVTTPGLYTVVQIIDGCPGVQGSGTAAPSTTPSVPVVSVTDNCGSSILTVSGYTGSLLWSTGETTESITVTAAGTYTVTQTVNGCISASAGGEALPKLIPAAPSVSVVNNCNNSVITAANYSGSLLWSTGEITESITVTAAGTYTVTQTMNGCVSTAGSGVAEPASTLIAAPVITVENNCGSSILSASGYTGTLLWSTGETTASITVTAGGTYSVVQVIEGCQGIAGTIMVTPKLIPAAPAITVVNNCGSATLTAGNYTGSLLWSTGETTPSITVTSAGIYSVTQTVDGCTSSESSGEATPLTIVAAPVITVVNNCGSSTLTAGGYTGSLLWSTGETTESITVTNSGTYTVNQTIGQCTSGNASAAATPIVIPSAPAISVVNSCENSVLTAGNYTGSLLWSTGETTASIIVTTGGTYTITQSLNGCISSSGSALAAPGTGSVSPPVITASGPTTFCAGGSVTLTSSLASGNIWSTGATTNSIVVTTSGTYTVQDANAGLCSVASDPVIVTVSPTPAGTISVLSTSLCENAAAVVTFNATPGAGTGPYNLIINGVTYNNIVSGIPFVTTSMALPGTSLWPTNPTPASPLKNDGQPLEVGMKFRVSANGVIRSIRFYKGSNNDASTYTLKLYQNSSRTLLASVTFSDRTATGWQTVPLPTPVSVTAGTTYLVSYHSPSGNYANNLNYFTTARTNGGITGLATGTDGSNGVYRYGSAGGFPTNTYQAGNYWVDVVYATSSTMTLNLTSVTNTITNCTVTGNLSSVTLQVVSCPVILARSVSGPETIAEKEIIPKKLELGQNHPNPFESGSLIDFSLPDAGRVKLVMYDLNGRVVAELLNEVREAGTYTIPVSKDGLKAGIYYYRIEFKGEMIVRKMMIL